MITKKFANKKPDLHFYWQLFKSTFLISAFTVGGGYVIIPLLKAKYVDEYGWLDDKETLSLVAVSQSMPGVVAVNASIILGYRMAGIKGTLTALLATVLPPLVTLSIIAYFYNFFAANRYIQYILKGMQCGATALIVNVAINMIKKEIEKKLLIPLLILTGTFIAALFFNINIMYLVFIDGLIGLFFLRAKKYN
ncbi:chromate transporter [Pectinatus sottacetonis]|uniref:chromate transporter n=1 Tax=Pectinatus sottacetonis TaxID=1002795 RepID=UPI0018C54025|nr:chromate transporter [Pectinatus sottacetonis]